MDIVTGGLGFIGNELVRQLQASGREVVIIDSGLRKAPNIEDIQGVLLYHADIVDAKAIEEIVCKHKPERIFHLAALHYIPECNANPEQCMRTNVEGTLSVLNAAVKNKCHHFLFASTGAVYADSSQLLSEEASIGPVDVYGRSKWFGEELCRTMSVDIPITICRLFNNIGLRETNPHIVPEIINQLKTGSRELELGNIHTVRDYISTEDTAYALRTLADHIPQQFETYNIATGKGYSVADLIRLMEQFLGQKITVVTDPTRFRTSDKEVQIANVTKLSKALDWHPEKTLEEVMLGLMRFEGLVQ